MLLPLLLAFQQAPLAALPDTLRPRHDALHHDVFAGGHRWHGEQAYPFLARHLALGSA